MIWWLSIGSDFQQQHLCHQLREIPYPDASHSEPPGSPCQLHLQLLAAQDPTRGRRTQKETTNMVKRTSAEGEN
ncbi:hypothetical protein MUG91_G241n6 [Manis pentadactyla]|nr:hypothetical protein MUG91_G241n6 [Manis pentadactyla]